MATRTDPQLWEKVKKKITKGDKGGNPGQWSARKAQLAVQEYKRQGGGYIGRKSPNNSLVRWTQQDWQYSGEPGKSRYLPRQAIENLSAKEIQETSRAKLRDTRAGRQYSPQPKRIAAKVKPYRTSSPKSPRKRSPNRCNAIKKASPCKRSPRCRWTKKTPTQRGYCSQKS